MSTTLDRSRALLANIESVSKLPMLAKASKAEALVREAAELLVDISIRVEALEQTARNARRRLDSLEGVYRDA